MQRGTCLLPLLARCDKSSQAADFELATPLARSFQECRATARVSSKFSKTRTTPYDVAEHLRTPEEMAAYLDAWLEEEPYDVPGFAKALGDIA
jgi:hypothetical protein